MTDLAKLVVTLETQAAKYIEGLNQAESRLKRFHDRSETFLRRLGGQLAAFFTIRAAAQWGRDILLGAESLKELSQSTGVAVENLAGLQFAFSQDGVAAEDFSTSLRKLNQSISEAAGNAKSEAAAAFRAMGIEVRDASGRIKAADSVLGDMADRFKEYADGPNKVAIATELLGRSGERMIPGLNGGAEALKRLADEARAAGLVVSEDTATAVGELNDAATRLQATLVNGIGNKVAALLLPIFEDLTEEMGSAAEQTERFDEAARVLAAGLKILVSAGLIVGHTFDAIGKVIGSTVAAIVSAAKGNFSEAFDILRMNGDDQVRADEVLWERLKKVWADGSESVLREVRVTARKMREDAPNLAGGKALTDQADAAIRKLKDMAAQLSEQVDTFGLGEAAAIRYRLEIGALADEVKAAGTDGRALAEAIERQADALERLKRSKEIADGLREVAVQMNEIRGDDTAATIARFDAQNLELAVKLHKEGNEEGLKQLLQLRDIVALQAEYNAAMREADEVQSELARTEERIRATRDAGAITELGMQEQLDAARKEAVSDLQEINAELAQMAEAIGNPAMIERVRALGGEIGELQSQTNLLAKAIRANAEEAFGEFFSTVIRNVHSIGDAFDALVDDILNNLSRMAGQQLAQAAFSAIGGLEFGGGKAEGGPLKPGEWYLAGERGVEPIWGGGPGAFAAGYGGRSGSVSLSTQVNIGANNAVTRSEVVEAVRAAQRVTLSELYEQQRKGVRRV